MNSDQRHGKKSKDGGYSWSAGAVDESRPVTIYHSARDNIPEKSPIKKMTKGKLSWYISFGTKSWIKLAQQIKELTFEVLTAVLMKIQVFWDVTTDLPVWRNIVEELNVQKQPTP
jgi:hypothetical protein